MIKISKNCITCIHEDNKFMCEKYCFVFSHHEFKCYYCIRKFSEMYNKFCACENDDGSQNCCGDHFEFNNDKFEVI